ncbi:MAG: F0F1 ATP synthase subunit B [Actinobacteria bacterium]|nr:F0F1 ATP synthase subunit B [Actinomycetota bacterium]NBV89831.1 F0F1 ATP synthase subunit B [Actinomycetota bacterium]NBY15684.1 F0F1 ATP synthase subunit B [Actinomycetota bacterium]
MTTFILASAEEQVNILRVPLDELVIGTVAFLLVFFALAKFAFPRINKTLEERADAIEGGIKRAQESQEEAAALLESYKSQLAEARTEAAAIRNQAQAEKAAIIEQAKSEAAAAAAAVTERASASIEAERAQAIASLRRDVSDLALNLAGKVVGETLQDDAKARATVDRFIADLEAQAAK